MTGPNLIKDLDHVAIGVHSAAEVPAVLVGEHGATPHGSGPGGAFLWWQFSFARNSVVEILEPDGPAGGFLHRFLESRGPGIHHVTFKVSDLAAAADHARSMGYEIVGYLDAHPSWKEAFLHPKQAQGIVVQLAESHPELEPDDMGAYPFPQLPEAATTPTDLVAVRLQARSAERARHQWEATLGGRCEEINGMLEFRWPDSPLCIRVDVDPAGPEGPIALEFAADTQAALPEGPHPLLGITLRTES